MANDRGGWFVFVWRRGEKPRLIGPFDDMYAANRRLRWYEPRQGYYAWTLQPEAPADPSSNDAPSGVSSDG